MGFLDSGNLSRKKVALAKATCLIVLEVYMLKKCFKGSIKNWSKEQIFLAIFFVIVSFALLLTLADGVKNLLIIKELGRI